MKNPRKKLYAILLERNSQEEALDRPHLSDPDKLLWDLVNLCDDNTAEQVVEEYTAGGIDRDFDRENEASAEDEKTSFMEYLAWYIFFLAPSAKDNARLLRNVLRELLVCRTGFLPVLQNRAIILLPKMLNALIKGYGQMDVWGGLTVDAMEDGHPARYVMRNAQEHPFTGGALKLLFILCNELYYRKGTRVYIPLESYRQAIGSTSLASAERTARDQLAAIKHLDVAYSEKRRGRWQNMGTVDSICSGLARVVGGTTIEFGFTEGFAAALRQYPTLLVRDKTLQLNPKSVEFFFSVFFDTNHKLNEGDEDRENRTTVRTLLDNCPYIPSEEKCREKHWSTAIHRQVKAIDALDKAGLEWRIIGPNGAVVDQPPKYMPYADFMGSTIEVATEYPVRNALLERRRKHEYEQAIEYAKEQQKKEAKEKKKRGRPPRK